MFKQIQPLFARLVSARKQRNSMTRRSDTNDIQPSTTATSDKALKMKYNPELDHDVVVEVGQTRDIQYVFNDTSIRQTRPYKLYNVHIDNAATFKLTYHITVNTNHKEFIVTLRLYGITEFHLGMNYAKLHFNFGHYIMSCELYIGVVKPGDSAIYNLLKRNGIYRRPRKHYDRIGDNQEIIDGRRPKNKNNDTQYAHNK